MNGLTCGQDVILTCHIRYMRRMYFVGVTTGQSSVHKIFARWAEIAGVPDAVLAGIDNPVGAPAQSYMDATRTIRDDPESWGALVTTHKISIYEHGRAFFTDFDADAGLLGEVSCIVRRPDRMEGIAVDPIPSRLALEAIVGHEPFPGDVLI